MGLVVEVVFNCYLLKYMRVSIAEKKRKKLDLKIQNVKLLSKRWVLCFNKTVRLV
jgi:hypothetical protein